MPKCRENWRRRKSLARRNALRRASAPVRAERRRQREEYMRRMREFAIRVRYDPIPFVIRPSAIIKTSSM